MKMLDVPRGRITIQELYASCEEGEKRIEAISFRKRAQSQSQRGLFSVPLFYSDPLGGWEPFEQMMYHNGFPFNFSLAPPGNLKVSELEWRYRELLRQLMKLSEMDLRWLLIARWLQQEGVCKSEAFLPPQILQRLVKNFGKRYPDSPEVLHHWVLIKCWLPYFRRLLDDLRKAPKTNRGPKEWLEKQGYDSHAIVCAQGKRSAVPATADWLSGRVDVNSRTLQNDYSKCRPDPPRRRKSRS